MARLPELLAPAGSMEALRAAVANGADAVYLGGKDFSARKYADNFTSEELAAAVEFAHLRGVKVYVTVNTLIAPEEFSRALDYLFELAGLGVDGVLVQDLGLARAARQVLPELPLHASTQMTIHNVEGVRFLAGLGLRRVVLARELSLEDIRRIRDACPEVEIEVFVHGALCFSYSGQCLLSSFVGARSGNRGRCAQPCRLRYRLKGGPDLAADLAEGHLLSTRDLNLITLLPELIAAGIAALKIEGRMRRAEYVATVTRIYRRALDRCARDPQAYRATEEELRELAQIFNREFTTGYLLGNPGLELMSHQRPNNRGVYLGRVSARRHRLVAVELCGALRLGDGVEFWVTRGGRQGLTVGEMWKDGKLVEEAAGGDTVWLPALPGVAVGDRVFKTHDRLLMEKARASYAGPGAGQVVPLSLVVAGEPGKPLVVTGRDDRGNKVTVLTEVDCQVAEKHPLTPETLADKLGRLGGTAFYLKELTTALKGELMVPLSSLNEARRRLVRELAARRLEAARPYPRIAREDFLRRLSAFQAAPLRRGPRPGKPLITVAVAGAAAAREALAAGADRVYLAAERWQDAPPLAAGDAEEIVKEAAALGREVFPALPRIWHPVEDGYLRAVVEFIGRLNPRGILVGGPGGWEAARHHFPKAELVADYTFNPFNAATVNFLRELGFAGLTLSPELNRHQLAALAPLSPVGGEVIVHGNFPLMVSAHCPIGACCGERQGERVGCSRPCRRSDYILEDRLGYNFPLACDRQCRFYLFNSRELCLLSELPNLLALKPFGLRLELRRAPAEEVAVVVRSYRLCLERCLAENASPEFLAETEAELVTRLGRPFTRGHYHRGV